MRLGSALYAHGFVGAGTSVVVENGAGVRSLDLTSGKTSALPEPVVGRFGDYVGRIAALTSRSYLRVLGDIRSDGAVAPRLVSVDGSRGGVLPITLSRGAGITGVCSSPNGEYAAVLTQTSDDALILIIGSSSGAVEASLAGTTMNWCQAIPSGPDEG